MWLVHLDEIDFRPITSQVLPPTPSPDWFITYRSIQSSNLDFLILPAHQIISPLFSHAEKSLSAAAFLYTLE